MCQTITLEPYTWTVRILLCIIEADLDAIYAKGDEAFAEKDADA